MIKTVEARKAKVLRGNQKTAKLACYNLVDLPSPLCLEVQAPTTWRSGIMTGSITVAIAHL